MKKRMYYDSIKNNNKLKKIEEFFKIKPDEYEVYYMFSIIIIGIFLFLIFQNIKYFMSISNNCERIS